MAFFRYEGHKLAYTIHGRGARTTVLMPGLLLSQKMQTPLASDLAGHGNRVVTFDSPRCCSRSRTASRP
jgi:pimeloyl-ACP methyl ester carboxylesterase